MIELPVCRYKETFLQQLQDSSRIVVTAPTGSGKSTILPQYVLENLASEERILVLQPRRLAAKMLSSYVAEMRGEKLGGEVGFVTRLESAVSDRTRLLFITEGILPRMFHSDELLSGVGAVIFDEFHERALSADLGIGLMKRLQEKRPELKLLVMSATLHTEKMLEYLQPASLLETEGRVFPVDILYSPNRKKLRIWEHAAREAAKLISDTDSGDILVFMPGAFEIRKTIEVGRALCGGVEFLPLYGDLPPSEQNRIRRPGEQRRVIVATNIAETSLTIPGVRYVVDSGLVRMHRYDPGKGMDTLPVEPITRFSAEQRSGRAGREAPGRCVRLWNLQEQLRKPAASDPEIKRADLAQVVLHLKALGCSAETFPWFDKPDEDALAVAGRLLKELAYVDENGELNADGEIAAAMPLPPRLTKLLIEANRRGVLKMALLVAALLGEKPIALRGYEGFSMLAKHFSNMPDARTSEKVESDLFVLLNAVRECRNARFSREFGDSMGVNVSAVRRVLSTADYYGGLCRRIGLNSSGEGSAKSLMFCLLKAFPDHLAARRDKGTLVCRLRDDKVGTVANNSTVREAELVLAAEVREGIGGKISGALLSMNTCVESDWLEELFPDAWDICEEHRWNAGKKEVEVVSSVSCLGVVLEQSVSRNVNVDEAAAILASELMRNRLSLKNWNDDVDRWMKRVRWVAEMFPEKDLLTYDETDVELIIQDICAGEYRYAAVKNKECLVYVQNALSWEEQQFVRDAAPDRIKLPNGKHMRIRYESGCQPTGKARIQELFDLEKTPRIGEGRVPVLMEILAPNFRAVQITDDLENFWKNLYPTVKKELSRRYHKHEWR